MLLEVNRQLFPSIFGDFRIYYCVFRRRGKLHFAVLCMRPSGWALSLWAGLHQLHTHSLSPNNGVNSETQRPGERTTPSASAAGLDGAAVRSRRTREVPRRARRSPGSARIFMSWPHRPGQGRGRDCKGDRAEVTKERLLSEGKRRRRGRTRRGGWQADKKGPEPRPRWKTRSGAHRPGCTHIYLPWQKLPKPLGIGCAGFPQSFVLGRINRHQLFTRALGLGEADSKSLPGGISASRCSCAALAGGSWESLCSLTLILGWALHAVHPPHPQPGRSLQTSSPRGDLGRQICRPADKGFLSRLDSFSTNRIKTGLQRSLTDGFAFAPFSSLLY